MTDPTDFITMADAMFRGGGLDTPRVDPLVSVVRSGEQFLIIGSGAVPAVGLGSVVVEWGYEVAAERRAVFQDFLANFEGQLDTNVPDGVTYRGTYAVFQQSERSLGSFRTIWSFASLADLQKLTDEVATAVLPAPIDAAAFATAAWSWGQLVRILLDFRDTDYAAGRSQVILQPAAVTLF